MKNYKYMGYEFRATENICLNNMRKLYEIDGLKTAGERPFLTSIADVHDFIKNAVYDGYWMDGNANYHMLPKGGKDNA